MSGKRLLLNCPLLIITLALAFSSHGAGEISEPIQVEKDEAKMENIPEPAAARPAETAGPKEPQQQPGKVLVEFYIRSQCPFGTQVQKGIKPVLDRMGAYIDYKQEFIAKELGGGKFNSLHGENEVMGDIAQLCMARYYPESHKYMDAVLCMAQDMKNIPNNWKDCAAKNGLDTQKIQTCYDGEEGKNLLSESAKRAKEAKASGSPTMFIAGEKYTGGRGDKELETAICDYNEKLEGCPAGKQ